MGTKARWRGNVLEFYDSATHERVKRLAPVVFEDDFIRSDPVILALGSAASGCRWVKKVVLTGGSPDVAILVDQAGGVVQCALDNASEKQDAGLCMDDNRSFDLTKGLIMEFRAKVSVTPTLLAEVIMGLVDDWTDGLIDSATYQVSFNLDGSTAIRVQMDDDATDLDEDSGLTAAPGDWHIYRIDATVVSDIKFYVDGAHIATTNTFNFAATGANAILQPYFGLYKASGAGVGTLLVDKVNIWQNR